MRSLWPLVLCMLSQFALAAPGELPLAVPLSQYALPNQAELLNEAGASFDGGKAVRSLHDSLRNMGSRRARPKLERQCQALAESVSNVYEPTNATVACLPYFLSTSSMYDSVGNGRPIVRPLRDASQWSSLAGRSFAEARRMIEPRKLQKAEEFVVALRETANDCQYRNSAAALVFDLEEHLPSERAWELLREVYDIAKPCLRLEEDGFEQTHLRMGLLYIVNGNPDAAVQALSAALTAKAPQEEFRTLYWLGSLERVATNGPERITPHWALLRKKYPIGIHGILAASALGNDPLPGMGETTPPVLHRRTANKWSRFDAAAFALELMLASNDTEGAREWADFLERNRPTTVPEEVLLLGVGANRAGAYRASIALLASYLNDTGFQRIDARLLDLYFPRPFLPAVLAHSDSLPPNLLLGLIRQESAFNPNARSGAGAVGLMQLMPRTARAVWRAGAARLNRPEENVRTGVAFLRNLLGRFSGSIESTLAAYNAGPTPVHEWQRRYLGTPTLLAADLIPYAETRQYVSLILRNSYWYARILASSEDARTRAALVKTRQGPWKSEVLGEIIEQVLDGELTRIASTSP